MSQVLIVPEGRIEELASELVPGIDPFTGKPVFHPQDFGAGLAVHDGHEILTLKRSAFERAQRECFRGYYVLASRILSLRKDAVLRDKTIVSNLMMEGYECFQPLRGRSVIEDASPHGMELLLLGKSRATFDAYVALILAASYSYVQCIRHLGGNYMGVEDAKNYFVHPDSNREKTSGVSPFRLPAPQNCRLFDQEAVRRMLMRGASTQEAENAVKCNSPMAIYWNSYSIAKRTAIYGDRNYARNLVAETLVDLLHEGKKRTTWGERFAAAVSCSWYWDGEHMDTKMPCSVIGKARNGMIEIICHPLHPTDAGGTHQDAVGYCAPPHLILVCPQKGADVAFLRSEGFSLADRKSL